MTRANDSIDNYIKHKVFVQFNVSMILLILYGKQDFDPHLLYCHISCGGDLTLIPCRSLSMQYSCKLYLLKSLFLLSRLTGNVAMLHPIDFSSVPE